MSDLSTIALACARPDERALLAEWLAGAGYAPVALPHLASLDDALQGHPVEAVIADTVFLLRPEELRHLQRRLGGNRPLLLLGEAGPRSTTERGDLTVIERPLDRDRTLLQVGLALAEGRPARRYPRRPVEPVSASAQGISVKITHTSVGGVGLQVTARQAALPPLFNLRVPDFGVHVLVRRAWMASTEAGVMRCGGTVEGDLQGSTRPWAEFAREAPAPVYPIGRRR